MVPILLQTRQEAIVKHVTVKKEKSGFKLYFIIFSTSIDSSHNFEHSVFFLLQFSALLTWF